MESGSYHAHCHAHCHCCSDGCCSKPALRPFIERMDSVVNAGNRRCEEIQEKADNLFRDLCGNLNEFHENI